MDSTSAVAQTQEIEALHSDGSGGSTHQPNREQVLMWVIGSTFGLAMMVLLVAMCLAEISIQHNSSNASLAPAAAASPVTIAESR